MFVGKRTNTPTLGKFNHHEICHLLDNLDSPKSLASQFTVIVFKDYDNYDVETLRNTLNVFLPTL